MTFFAQKLLNHNNIVQHITYICNIIHLYNFETGKKRKDGNAEFKSDRRQTSRFNLGRFYNIRKEGRQCYYRRP